MAARKRVKWPGLAAVVVSVVHVVKGPWLGLRYIDKREVENITAFIFHRGGHNDPAKLAANGGLSFAGSFVLGMGFTFDDTDKQGVASSLAEMDRLIEKDSHNQEAVFPFIGGAEVNTSPTHTHHRFVINFGDMTEDDARRWPDLMAIVEEKVKPVRIRDNRATRRKHWWRFGETTPALFRAISDLSEVLVQCRISSWLAFAKLKTGSVFDISLNVFAIRSTNCGFTILQARPHEIWARFFGSSMKDDLRYTPSDCFETFPFPNDWQTHPTLETAGQTYYEFRAALMIRSDEGLTKTYNRFHNPEERDPNIEKLRELHAAMDRAVLDAYGWNDVPTDCEFLLDYEIDEEEWSPRRKKPWRYRWPDEVRDEVLARLLELNAERAKEEECAGLKGKKKGGGKRGKKRAGPSSQGDLFS